MDWLFSVTIRSGLFYWSERSDPDQSSRIHIVIVFYRIEFVYRSLNSCQAKVQNLCKSEEYRIYILIGMWRFIYVLHDNIIFLSCARLTNRCAWRPTPSKIIPSRRARKFPQIWQTKRTAALVRWDPPDILFVIHFLPLFTPDPNSSARLRIRNELSIFNPQIVPKLSEIWFGMFIPDPDYC